MIETTAMIDGRAVPLLPNDHPGLQAGMATPIYDDPMTRQKKDGIAVIRDIDEHRTDEDFLEARVEFVDEPGQFYNRRIYRKA